MTKLNNFMRKLNMAKVNEASSFKYVTKDGEERTYVRKMQKGRCFRKKSKRKKQRLLEDKSCLAMPIMLKKHSQLFLAKDKHELHIK